MSVGLITLQQNPTDPAAAAASHSHLYFKSDGKLYRMGSDGIATEVGASGGGSSNTTIVTLASDVGTTSTSYANVTGLSFAVTSGTMYRFYIVIAYTAASTSTASLWSLSGPSLTRGVWMTANGGAYGSVLQTYAQSTYDSGLIVTGSSGATNGACVMEGFVLPSASGTLIVRVASGTSGSAITAKAGSTITYW